MGLEQELAKDHTPEYEPPASPGGSPYRYHINPNRPVWRNYYIPLMMRDPRLRFGINVLKGRILQRVKFEFNTYDSEVGDILQTTYDRFWDTSASSVLQDMFVFGFSGQEAIYYRNENGDWEFDKLKYISPYDAKPITRDGNLVGMNVYYNRKDDNNPSRFVPCPKTFWAVHEPEINKWLGRTRLFGSFEPWWEKWCYRGARDLRANWFYRCAFRGPKIGYPPGSSPIEYGTTGTRASKKIPNREIAIEIADSYQSGGSLVYPNNPENSAHNWVIEDTNAQNVPEGLNVYMTTLDEELLEGIGVPPEVLVSDGTGAFAGRQVPNEAFVSVLEEPTKWLKTCIAEQICDPLIYLRLGKRVRYDVKITGLVESLPTASDGMFPSDVEDHQLAVADGTAGDPTKPQPSQVITNTPQQKANRRK